MKVLLYTHQYLPDIGGMQVATYEISRGMYQQEVELLVLAPKYKGSREFDKDIPFRIIRMPGTRTGAGIINYIISLSYLLYFIAKFHPDHLILADGTTHRIYGLFHFIIPTRPIMIENVPEIACFRDKSLRTRLRKKLLRNAFQKSKLILCVSNSTKEAVLSEISLPEDKIYIVPSGINEKFLSYIPDTAFIKEFKERYKITNKIVLTTIARLVREKGFDMVIRALPTILEEYKDVVYVIVGGGPDEKYLKRLAKEYRVENNVIFTGAVSHQDIIKYYDLADIFVMPQRRGVSESFGLVFAEAMARNLPVIGGREGGVLEVIEENITGYLVNPYNEKELAEKILTLLNNEDLRRNMGKKGRERVQKYFTTEVMAKKIVDILT